VLTIAAERLEMTRLMRRRPGARPALFVIRAALAWGAALVLVAGSLLFLDGGRTHPAINASLGAGADAFFHGFKVIVLSDCVESGMHLRILVGPLCWAVAAPALLDAIRPGARALGSAARAALVLAGALWAVAFVLDGFGAPVYAQFLDQIRASDPQQLEELQRLINNAQASQEHGA